LLGHGDAPHLSHIATSSAPASGLTPPTSRADRKITNRDHRIRGRTDPDGRQPAGSRLTSRSSAAVHRAASGSRIAQPAHAGQPVPVAAVPRGTGMPGSPEVRLADAGPCDIGTLRRGPAAARRGTPCAAAAAGAGPRLAYEPGRSGELMLGGACHGASWANASSRPRSMVLGWYPSAQIWAARRRAATWPGTMI
jgi:hypothetical protein